METVLRFLKTHCAKLALLDMRSHMQAFFYMLKKERSMNQWPVGLHDTGTSTPRSDELWQGCNVQSHQKTQNCNSHISHHTRSSYGIGPSGTRKKTWNGTAALRQVPMHGPSGTEAPGRNPGTVYGMKQTVRIEDYEEASPLFPEPVLAWFFLQKTGLEARKVIVILAATVKNTNWTRWNKQ